MNDLMKYESAVAIGCFDGVHRGHKAVLQAASAWAEAHDALALAYAFEAPPRRLFGKETPRLMTAVQKKAALFAAGIHEVRFVPFTAALAALSPADFVRDELIETHHAVAVFCGEDFRFGKDAAGDVAALRALLATYGAELFVIPAAEENGEKISSTAIRTALTEGDAAKAARLLGRPYALCGKVVRGAGIGGKYGMPTANLEAEKDVLLPHDGVYLSAVTIDGVSYPALTNVGMRPTVGGESRTVESLLRGFEGDLYGHEITVSFVRFLRPERKFASAEELAAQVKADFEALA